MTTKQMILQSGTSGSPTLENFKLIEKPLDQIKSE
jgi:hypothetical protein